MSETPHPMIYAALSAVMGDVGHVGKTRKNTQQNYQFRGIDDVLSAVQDVLVKHGVVVVPRVLKTWRSVVQTKGGSVMYSVRLLVEHKFYARDGSHVVCVTLGEAMDTGDKASNKAMSQALKYALVETLCIPTYEKDRDTEEHSPELAAQQQRSASSRSPAPAKPRAAPPTGDALDREKALLRASLEAARCKKDVDDLAKRFNALPDADKAELRPVFTARKQALPEVAS